MVEAPGRQRVDGAPSRRTFIDEDCPIRLGRSFRALQPGYGTAIFQLDLECEVVAIDVEGDIKIIRMQMWRYPATKALRLGASKNQSADGARITWPAFQKVT